MKVLLRRHHPSAELRNQQAGIYHELEMTPNCSYKENIQCRKQLQNWLQLQICQRHSLSALQATTTAWHIRWSHVSPGQDPSMEAPKEGWCSTCGVLVYHQCQLWDAHVASPVNLGAVCARQDFSVQGSGPLDLVNGHMPVAKTVSLLVLVPHIVNTSRPEGFTDHGLRLVSPTLKGEHRMRHLGQHVVGRQTSNCSQSLVIVLEHEKAWVSKGR